MKGISLFWIVYLLCILTISCVPKTYIPASSHDPNTINILDFGAIPDDGKDDSKGIQAAINHAIQSAQSSKVYCPPGTYDLHTAVMIAHRPQSEYEFVTMTFSGHIPAFSANSDIGSTSVFRIKNSTFGIGVQSARNVVIENLVFEGSAPYKADISAIFSQSLEDWTTRVGISANPFSPSSAIVIDPFHSAVSFENRYTGLEDKYTNNSNRGSSMVLIRGCSFIKHYIAIANNPSNGVQNGDNIRAEQCHVNSCHTFWSAGQTQSRGNSIENVYALFLHTFVSGVQIGKQQGTPPSISNVNLAGFCKKVFDIQTGFSGLNVFRSYFESVWSLGVSHGLSTSFDQCQIKFYKPDDFIPSPPFHLHTNNVTSFRDCSIEYFNNCKTPIPFLMKSRELLVSGGHIEGGVIVADGITNAGGDDLHKVQLEGVFIKCLGKVAGKKTTMKPSSKLKNEIIMGGEVLISNEGEVAVNQSTTYNIDYMEKASLTAEKYTMVFASNALGKYQLGDNLFTGNNLYASTCGLADVEVRPYLGYVSNISGQIITISGVPAGTIGGKHTIYKVFFPIVDISNRSQKGSSEKIARYKRE